VRRWTDLTGKQSHFTAASAADAIESQKGFSLSKHQHGRAVQVIYTLKGPSALVLCCQMVVRYGRLRDKSRLAIHRVGDVLGLRSCKCTNRVECWRVGRLICVQSDEGGVVCVNGRAFDHSPTIGYIEHACNRTFKFPISHACVPVAKSTRLEKTPQCLGFDICPRLILH
jgi:hypothetical protein